MKGKKRKQKERYDEDVEEEQEQKQLKVEAPEPRETAVGNGQKQPEEAEEKAAEELQGLPIVPMQTQRDRNCGIIFVLEKASLEVAKVGKVCSSPYFHRIVLSVDCPLKHVIARIGFC